MYEHSPSKYHSVKMAIEKQGKKGVRGGELKAKGKLMYSEARSVRVK
jgi:hypothetical protein